MGNGTKSSYSFLLPETFSKTHEDNELFIHNFLICYTRKKFDDIKLPQQGLPTIGLMTRNN